MKIVSWNLRYDNKPDRISVEESLKNLRPSLEQPRKIENATREKPWSTRRIKVAQEILNEDVVLAGFQEALIRQVRDMKELLGPDEWGCVGAGRDDGGEKGEFCPIFYRKSHLELQDSDTFWLSKTPFTPTIYPGAGTIRICTVARFKNLLNPDLPILTMANTHLDHISEEQRKYGASLVLARARFEAFQGDGPVIVTGDFNSSATGQDRGAYEIMTGALMPLTISDEFLEKYCVPKDKLLGFHMVDLRGVPTPLRVSGNFATFTDFKSPENSAKGTARIDFIFGDSEGAWSCKSYVVRSALSDDGILASDHRPVYATVEFSDAL